jgi:glycine cleavage system H protein
MNTKKNMLYSKDHEWAEVIGTHTVRIGISDFAQDQLGDIVFVELPEISKPIQSGESMGTIESVKTVSDLFSPVTGIITKVNQDLLLQPELINNDPYAGGWMVEIEVINIKEALSNLLTEEQYNSYISE